MGREQWEEWFRKIFHFSCNYRTVSGSDRMLHSAGRDSLAGVMTEQDLIKAVNYVCMTKANLDLD
jgi:hypothetical protein